MPPACAPAGGSNPKPFGARKDTRTNGATQPGLPEYIVTENVLQPKTPGPHLWVTPLGLFLVPRGRAHATYVWGAWAASPCEGPGGLVSGLGQGGWFAGCQGVTAKENSSPGARADESAGKAAPPGCGPRSRLTRQPTRNRAAARSPDR